MLVSFEMLKVLEIQPLHIQETKNQTLEPPDLIQINAILAHNLKKLQEDVKVQKKLENQQLEVSDWKECEKASTYSL